MQSALVLVAGSRCTWNGDGVAPGEPASGILAVVALMLTLFYALAHAEDCVEELFHLVCSARRLAPAA